MNFLKSLFFSEPEEEEEPKPPPMKQYTLRARIDGSVIQLLLPGGKRTGTKEECEIYRDRLLHPSAPEWVNVTSGYNYSGAVLPAYAQRSLIAYIYIEES